MAGWNEPEYEAFGIDLPTDHDTRYRLAQEWLDVVRRLWSYGSFDHDGEFFHLNNVHSDPKPIDDVLPL